MFKSVDYPPHNHTDIIGRYADGVLFIGRYSGGYWFDNNRGEVEPHEIDGWIKKVDLRTNPISQLIMLTESWALDRNLVHGSNPQAQYVKLIEEAGELAGAIARNQDIRDHLGDMLVVMIILASQCDTSLQECLATAYEEIKDRKGKMVDGVFIKEQDLGMM